MTPRFLAASVYLVRRGAETPGLRSAARALAAGLAVVAGLVAGAGAAHAEYSLCNKTSYVLSAAIGHVDGDRLATRGWWRLRPGECKVVLTEQLTPGRYFAYAETIPGHRGDLRAWSGDTPLCVQNSGLFNLRNQDACADDPTLQRRFFAVDVSEEDGGKWQTEFVEATTYSVFSAEVAGVQRLLNDVGASDVRIDGAFGRKTRADLDAWRAAHNLEIVENIDDITVDALIDEANALEARRGFFFCNRGDRPVWSALAEPQDEGYRARGWWRVAGGACVKVSKGALAHDHYYVYAAIDEPGGERRLKGGERIFCVKPVPFDTESSGDCAAAELDEAAFRRVDTGTSEAATFDFQPDMFLAPASASAGSP